MHLRRSRIPPAMTADPEAPTTRLFFAIVPDAAALARLDRLARETARAAGGRASAAATLHLTIVFVGAVAADKGAIVRAVGDAMRWPAFELSLDTLGWFERAAVAWAAPSRAPDALAAANRVLARALADRGVPVDTRPYRPHLTLARRCRRAVGGAIEPPIAWPVDRVVLMSSQTLPEGARYREIAGWPTG